MGKKSDKGNKKSRQDQTTAPAPVNTGTDLRAENRSGGNRERKNRADAPDGVSGNWI